jgi:hypothetical protein
MNNQAFITFAGLDFSSFQYLLSKVSPLYNAFPPYSDNGKIVAMRAARVKLLGLTDCHGLVLGNA